MRTIRMRLCPFKPSLLGDARGSASKRSRERLQPKRQDIKPKYAGLRLRARLAWESLV